jgi:hypothetical protein
MTSHLSNMTREVLEKGPLQSGCTKGHQGNDENHSVKARSGAPAPAQPAQDDGLGLWWAPGGRVERGGGAREELRVKWM